MFFRFDVFRSRPTLEVRRRGDSIPRYPLLRDYIYKLECFAPEIYALALATPKRGTIKNTPLKGAGAGYFGKEIVLSFKC